MFSVLRFTCESPVLSKRLVERKRYYPFVCLFSSETCCNLWTTESKDWFQNQMDLGLFNAYFYYPPKAAYAKPHLLDTNVLVCDLFVHAPDNNCKLWKFSYERPKLESHLGFQLIANRFAAHCAFLESELNRKKSQRVLKDAMSKTEGRLSSLACLPGTLRNSRIFIEKNISNVYL